MIFGSENNEKGCLITIKHSWNVNECSIL